MAKAPKPAGSEQDNDDWVPTDSDLGVGEETEAGLKAAEAARVTAAMQDPAIAKAITQLVEQRLAEAVAANGTVAGTPPGIDFLTAMKALGDQIANSINRTTAATMEQMPGHVKPIPPEEVERRAAAWVELQSMLSDVARQYWSAIERGKPREAETHTPIYILDEDFFGPGEVGSEMYPRGATIRWYGAPGTFMEPRNEIAQRLADLMWDYLGNENAPNAEDLAEKASQMNRPSTPGAILPEMPLLLSARGRGRPNASVVAEMGIAERGPDGIVGTVVKVTRGGFGHSVVTDGPGLAQHSIGPRTGPHQVRAAALADAAL
jgi:hypothetical protein